MSELPEGWSRCQVGDYVRLKNGFAFKSNDYVKPDQDTVPVIRISDLNGKFSSSLNSVHIPKSKTVDGFEIKTGDLLIAMSGATTGKVGVYIGEEPACQNQRVGNLKLVSDKHGYLSFRNYLISNLSERILKAAYGGAQPNISSKAVEELLILLPPLNEQKRIADKLDRLLTRVDTCRERCDRIPLILKRFRQSVLAAATSGELTEDWRDAQNITEITRTVFLRDVALNFSYGTSAKSSSVGSVPVLRMGNIQNSKLDWNDLVFTSNVDEIKKYKLRSGDVLFNRTNSPELVGKTAVYKDERPAIYAGYLIRVQCNTNLLPDYLNYCLNSPAGRDCCWRVKSDGVSQSNINAKKLAEFEFQLPPILEHQEIVRRVEKLFAFADRLEARYKTARAQVDRLTPALLEKAFQGELVPQDPNDEPASVLLERIRSELTTAKANKPGRRR